MKEKRYISWFIFSYFVLRILFLLKLPIFNDEAIYLDWGQRSISLPNHLFYSLYDGKQPLLLWVFGFFQKIFINPLLAGRIVSILISLISTIGIYKTSKLLFSKKIAVISSFLYLIIPIFAFYDRQALMEAAVSCTGIWIYYYFQKIQKKQTTNDTLMLSTVLGLGMLIKNSAFLFIVPLLILSGVSSIKNKRASNFVYILSALMISQVIMLIVYIQPEYWNTLSSNSRYVLSLSELLTIPIQTWISNTVGIIDILFWQQTPFLFTLLLFGLALSFNKNSKTKQTSFWILIQLILVMLLSKKISPRYLVSFIPLSTILISHQIDNIFTKSSFGKGLVIIGILFSTITTLIQNSNPLVYFYLLKPISAHSQENEYIRSWTSGYGVHDAVKLIKKEADGNIVTVATRLDTGNPESSVFAYFQNSRNIKPVYLDQKMYNSETFKYDCIKSDSPVYFVSRSNNISGFEKYFTEIERFYKPKGNEYVGLFKLKEDCTGNTLQI